MDNNTTYILQKDIVTPGRTIKAGTRYAPYLSGRSYYMVDTKKNPHYVSAACIKNNPEWFKKEEPKQWEIISGFNEKDGVHPWGLNPGWGGTSCPQEGCKIHSVKRLSDNEVFSIGDEFGGGYSITSFKIEGEQMMHEMNSNGYYYNINVLCPPKLKQPTPIHNIYCDRDEFGWRIVIRIAEHIRKEKLDDIKKAAHDILFNSFNKTVNLTSTQKFYSADELLEAQQHSFYAARSKQVPYAFESVHNNKLKDKYPTFADYVQSTENQSLNK